jgi:deoxyribodipyrimidine photolyase
MPRNQRSQAPSAAPTPTATAPNAVTTVPPLEAGSLARSAHTHQFPQQRIREPAARRDAPGAPGKPEFLADIQSWIDDPATNFGWILVGSATTSATARQFASSEFAMEQYRPRLEVVYAPIPEPSTVMPMGGLAAIAFAARRRRATELRA